MAEQLNPQPPVPEPSAPASGPPRGTMPSTDRHALPCVVSDRITDRRSCSTNVPTPLTCSPHMINFG